MTGQHRADGDYQLWRRCAEGDDGQPDDKRGHIQLRRQLDSVPDKVVPAQQQQSDAGEQQQGQCHGIVPDGREVSATDCRRGLLFKSPKFDFADEIFLT